MWQATHTAAAPEMFGEPYATGMQTLSYDTRETMPIDSTPVGVLMMNAHLLGPSFGLDYHKLPAPWWDPYYKLDVLNKQISNIQASQFNHQLEKLMSTLVAKKHWLYESLRHLKSQNFIDQLQMSTKYRFNKNLFSDITHGQERGEYLSRGIPYELTDLSAGYGQHMTSQWHNLTDYTADDQAAILQSMGYKESPNDGASTAHRADGCYSHDDKYSCQADITPLDVYNEKGAQVYRQRCFWDENHIEPGSANAQRGVMGRCLERKWDEGYDTNFEGTNTLLNNTEWGCNQAYSVGKSPPACVGANKYFMMRQRFPDKLFPKEGIVQKELPDPKREITEADDEKVPVEEILKIEMPHNFDTSYTKC